MSRVRRRRAKNPAQAELKDKREYVDDTAEGLYEHTRLPLMEVLSQYGDDRLGFREQPRFEDTPPGRGAEYDVSMQRGRRTATECYIAMMGISPKPQWGPKVRYFVASRLMSKKYWPMASPREGNPGHASVCGPGIHSQQAREWWLSRERVPLRDLEEE